MRKQALIRQQNKSWYMHSIKFCVVNCVRLLSHVQVSCGDTDFNFMKMDAYCKDLQEEAANANSQNEPIQYIRNVRLWQESWEVPKCYGWKGQKRWKCGWR